MQDLVTHLSQLFYNPPFGFRRFLNIPSGILDHVQQLLNPGLKFRLILQSLFQTPLPSWPQALKSDRALTWASFGLG